ATSPRTCSSPPPSSISPPPPPAPSATASRNPSVTSIASSTPPFTPSPSASTRSRAPPPTSSPSARTSDCVAELLILVVAPRQVGVLPRHLDDPQLLVRPRPAKMLDRRPVSKSPRVAHLDVAALQDQRQRRALPSNQIGLAKHVVSSPFV